MEWERRGAAGLVAPLPLATAASPSALDFALYRLPSWSAVKAPLGVVNLPLKNGALEVLVPAT